MFGMTFEILFIILLISANGLFAMSEIAIISARKARLQELADAGDSGARVALELANAPNHFLSTVQIGITLIGILAGAFGGATIAEKLGASLQHIPKLAPYGEAIGIAIVVLSITYLSLVIGELVPKRLALNNAQRIATAVARPMRFLSIIAYPAVRLLSFSTDVVFRALGGRLSVEPPVTEEEVKIMIQQGTKAGVFEVAEQDMVESVFWLGDRRVRALMTPRPDIVWLGVDDAPEKIRDKIIKSGYSRFPVGQGGLDNVLGMVRAKDLLAQCLAGQSIDLKPLLRHPLFVPEGMRALKLLELLKKSGTHIALVIDEYGGTEGLVTHHDILEAILGDIPTVDKPADLQAVQREDGSWLVDGLLSVEELKEIFHIGELPGEEKGDYHTMGGFVMVQMGRIPSEGDHFESSGLRFEVMDMDGRRVDKILVSRVRKD